MVSDYYGYEADVITVEEIKKLKIVSFDKLYDYMEELGIEHDDEIADVFIYGGDLTDKEISEEQYDKVLNMYEMFTKEFKARTGVGISMNHHNSQYDGSNYDEVDGIFYELHHQDIYRFTPQAEKLMDGLGFKIGQYVYWGQLKG